LRPLTVTKPKPLLKLGGKTILQHNLDELIGLVDEVILVVGYKGEMIKELIKDDYRGIKIKYIDQGEPIGTGHAAKLALPFLKEKFIIMNGDDVYGRDDIVKILKKDKPSLLLKEEESPSCFGQVVVDNGYVKSLVEKPEEIVSNLVNIGFYFLDKSFFNTEIEKSVRGEYEITDYLRKYLEKDKLSYEIAERWYPVSYPWNLLDANAKILEEMKHSVSHKAVVEKYATLLDGVTVGEGTVVKNGAYIEGPVYIGKNCTIGPNCSIRKFSSIGDNVKIGHAVEVKNTIVGDNTKIPHLSYFGDSIIGDNCNMAAGTIAANLRHDKETVKSMCKDKLIDTKRTHFGCVIGDNSRTGIGTMIYPGRKIWPNQTTLPNSTVTKDIVSD